MDERVERLIKWWSKPGSFDVAKRHGLHRFIRIAESSRTVDGDVFLHLLDKGYVQAIEGDRVANVSGGLPGRYKIGDFKHGVKCAKGGAAQAFIVGNRNGNQLIFDRVISAKHMIQFAYWDRFDQIRGISPLAAAINTTQDTSESIGYALARAKVSQLFAFLLRRAGGKAAGNVDDPESGEDDLSTKFGKGPIVLELDPSDEAEFLESKQPASEFREFMLTMFSMCLKALDIPYSFYDESFTNYSGARQALLLYEQSAKAKRADVRDLLNHLTYWRIVLWILDGVLVLPDGMTVDDLLWDWQASGLPWIDPLKETLADNKAVEGRLISRQRIAKRMGNDWSEIEGELKDEEAEIGPERLAANAPTQRVPLARQTAGSNSNGN